jgi:nicotinate-nucleotide adenylyltransferase
MGVDGPKRLGVMGGTFDPVHHGHLVTAEAALWQFHLDEVVFVPTGQPWMKVDRNVTSATYTRDTLRTLRDEAGGPIDLFFITGADAMLEIFHWKDPEDVFALAHFIAATRPGYELKRLDDENLQSRPNVSVMHVPALAISSTDIRRRVREGDPIRYLVPEGVQTYIEKTGLYRGGE